MSGFEPGQGDDTNSTWEEPKSTTMEINAKEEYGDMETFFHVEHLDDNFDVFCDQIKNIRANILKHQEARERYKTDLDADQYVDEYAQKIEDAFKSFRLGEAMIDVRELVQGATYEEQFNDLIGWANQYIDSFMINKHVARLTEIN